MSISEIVTLGFILFVFGGAAGVFTFVSLRLMGEWLDEHGFFVDVNVSNYEPMGDE